jgi:hypothetical protein
VTATVQIQADVTPVEHAYGKLRKAYEGLAEQLERVKSGHSGIEQTGMRAAKAAAEMGTSGQAAASRYTAELTRLKAELAAGTLNKQQYRQAVEAAKVSLEAETRVIKDQQTQAKKLQDFAKGVADSQKTAADRQREYLGQLRQAWQAGHLSAEQYQAAVKKASEEGKQLSAPLASARSEIIAMVSGLTLGVTSFTAIVNAVKEAKAESARLREEHARAQMDVAETQAESLKMLGPVSQQEAGQFLKRIEGIAAKEKMPDLKALYQAAADTLSSTGSDAEMTANILQALIPLSKSRPQELAPLAGAVADVSGIVGAKSADDIKRVVGMVLTTTGQSRITSLGAFKEAAAAMAGATAVDTGEDRTRAAREAGAAFAAIGGSIKDPDGALTKTATAALAVQLERLLPEKARQMVGEGGIEERREGTGYKTFDERLRAVQASRDLQLQFWQKLEGEKKASFRGPIEPVIRQLLEDSQSEISRRYDQAAKSISTDPAAYKQMVTNLRGASPQLQLTEFTAGMKSTIEEYKQADTEGARRAAITKQADQVLAETSPSDFRRAGQFLFGWAGSVIRRATGESPEQIALSRLETRRLDVLGQYADTPERIEDIERQRLDPRSVLPLSKRDLQRLNTLDKAIAQTRAFIRQTKEPTEPGTGHPAAAEAPAVTPRGSDGVAAPPGSLVGHSPAGRDPVPVLQSIDNRLSQMQTRENNRPTVGTSAAAGQLLTAQRQTR